MYTHSSLNKVFLLAESLPPFSHPPWCLSCTVARECVRDSGIALPPPPNHKPTGRIEAERERRDTVCAYCFPAANIMHENNHFVIQKITSGMNVTFHKETFLL